MKETPLAATPPPLQILAGLRLTVSHHAGNMRGFGFGGVVEISGRYIAEYSLHIQCPWRIEGKEGIITGFQDWYIFAGEHDAEEPESWNPGLGGSLQEMRLRTLFGCPFDTRRIIINQTNALVVTGVHHDTLGGLRIIMDGSLAIVVFPCASRGEQWRFFRRDAQGPLIVTGDS